MSLCCMFLEGGSSESQRSSLGFKKGGGINKEINGNLPEEVEDASFFAPFFFLK